MYDYLIVGAGLYGAVFAHEAKKAGKKVLVIDRRPNIAGNVYTEPMEGIQVHKYGAHISTRIMRSLELCKSVRGVNRLRTLRWRITTASCIPCRLICTPSTRCGVS